MKCEEIEELAGAYALQALPDDVLREVEDHLASCSAHPDIAGLRAVALSLAGAAPEREPPPTLKARLMEAIRRETAGGAQAVAPRAPTARLIPWFRPRFASYALATVLAAVVVGLLTWNLILQVSGDGGEDVTFVRTLTDSGAARGRILYIQEERTALLTVEGLAPLPAEKTYQVWAISDGEPTGIGLFNASESGEASTVIEADLSKVEIVAITIEPAGGSPQPTTEPILKAEI